MYAMHKQLGSALVLALGLVGTGVASATPIVMQFDHFNPNGELVDNYYDGGCGGSYLGGTFHCQGPNDGIVWTAAVAGDVGDGQNFPWNETAHEPSPSGVMSGSSTSVTLSAAAGFTTGISLYYANFSGDSGNIFVYSTTTPTFDSYLGGAALNGITEPCDDFSINKPYSCWKAVGVSFSGIARSVVLTQADHMVFDNVTIGSATPVTGVPEPAELGMFGLGVLLIGGFVSLRRRKQRQPS